MMGKKKKKFEVDDLLDDLNASDNNAEQFEAKASDINGSNQHDST